MAKEPTRYQCDNPACSLGSVGSPGHFTSGATAEFVQNLKGVSADGLEDGTDYGEGICPNCATKATAAGTFTPDTGHDPHDAHHQKVAAEVAAGKVDPAESQARFMELVGAAAGDAEVVKGGE
jgi:hypothetical protein